MRDKIKQIKEMYKISGYHKQFIVLFIIIIGSAILEIKVIPYITRPLDRSHPLENSCKSW